MNNVLCLTRNIKNWADSLNMNILTLNNQHSKLKVWCSKMPKISYCHRSSVSPQGLTMNGWSAMSDQPLTSHGKPNNNQSV